MKKLIQILFLLFIAHSRLYYSRYTPFYSYSFYDYSYPNYVQPSIDPVEQDIEPPATKNTRNNLYNLKKQISSIESLFWRFPSQFQVDELIESVDSYGIMKLLRQVSNDDLVECEDKMAYLLQILAKIKYFSIKKQKSKNQIKIITESSKEEIRRLQGQLQRLRTQKDTYKKNQLKNILGATILDLTRTYAQHSNKRREIPTKQGTILALQTEIQQRVDSSQIEKKKMTEQRIKLIQEEKEIGRLERQLKGMQMQEKLSHFQIRRSERIIETNNYMIRKEKRIQKQEQNEIEILKDKLSILKSESTMYQIKIQRIRTEISRGQAKEIKIKSQIASLQGEIKEEKEKIKKDELDDLQRMVQILQMVSPLIKNQVDRHHYECFGEGSVQVEQTGNVTVYILKGQQVGKYLQKTYGEAIQVPTDKTQVKLREISIFNPVWKNEFGSPFAKASLTEKKLNLGKFNCLSPSAAETGSGKIIAIDKGSIEVEDEGGHHVSLQLGACTRLESNGKLPQTGQTLYWKGVKNNEETYNLYCGSWL